MSERATAQFPIVDNLGLHARAATKLVQLASKFPCDVPALASGPIGEREERDGRPPPVRLEGNGRRSDRNGSSASGKCVKAIGELIASRFGEPR